MAVRRYFGRLANVPRIMKESDGGPSRDKQRTFACCRRPVPPLLCGLRAVAHSVVGANCCGFARLAGVLGPRLMCLPAQITRTQLRGSFLLQRAQPSVSIQTRRVGRGVAIFAKSQRTRAVAAIIPVIVTSSSSRKHAEIQWDQ
jgi:hypothetical protein